MERIHLDVSAPSARQGSFLGAATGHRGDVSGGTGATIEPPRAPSTPRAATASRQAIPLARPLSFWADSYVRNRSIHAHEERRRVVPWTLQESGTVVEDDTPGCKCAFGATSSQAGTPEEDWCPSRQRASDRVAKGSRAAVCAPRALPYYPCSRATAILGRFVCVHAPCLSL